MEIAYKAMPQNGPPSDKRMAADEAEKGRLEKSLEEGLRQTFPASDAINVIQPAPTITDKADKKSAG